MITTDHVLRAITDDGAFRVIAINSTETVRGVVAAQKALERGKDTEEREDLARIVGDLSTATILTRELMSPDFRVQGILTSDDGSRIVADAHPGGATRGLVQLAKGTTRFTFGPSSRLQMMRSLRTGALQQGHVSVPPGTGLGGAMMEYLQTSEQLICTAALGTIVRDNHVHAAGGWIVQLLPEASRGPLEVMTNRLTAIARIEHLLEENAADPAVLLGDILAGMPFTRTAEASLRFGCTCSEERVMLGLATIGRDEIKQMIESGEQLDIACDYCGKAYDVSPEKLRALLSDN